MTHAPAQWLRCTKRHPCRICHRPNWCGYTADGAAANCARTPSDKPIKSKTGEFVGYLHKLDATTTPRPFTRIAKPETGLTRHELAALQANYRTAVNPERLAKLCDVLDLSHESLNRLRIGWAHDRGAWSFPMTDAAGTVRGIRLRYDDGKKLSVKGGHEGLFVPDALGAGTLAVCEGPTSCAALLDMGFAAVGRPSCSGGVVLLCELLRKLGRRDVVIVADHDAEKTRPDGSTFRPGQDGAQPLAREAFKLCKSLKIIVPPFDKDARDWKRSGATAGVVNAVVRAANYWRP